MIEKIKKIQTSLQVFLTNFIDITRLILNFNSKEFDEKEKFCHSFKPKGDHPYYIFIWVSITVWSLSFVVLMFDRGLFVRNQKFLKKIFGYQQISDALLFMQTNQGFLRGCKMTVISLCLGFILIIQLYQIMAYVIIINKMIPLIRECTDKKEKFYFYLILLYYFGSIFVPNLMFYSFFLFLAYVNIS